MLKFNGPNPQGPKVQLGSRVVIVGNQQGNPTDIVGEVAGLSVSIPNLITHVKVVLADGKITTMEVQSLIVQVATVWRSAPNLWQWIGKGISDLFRKKKKPQNDTNTTPKG
jgi:hypothetical protein